MNSVEIADRNKEKLKKQVIDFFIDYARNSRPSDLSSLNTKELIDKLYVRLYNIEKEIDNAEFVDTIELTFKESGNNIIELIPRANFLNNYRFDMLYETTAEAYKRYEVRTLSDFAKSTIRAVEAALQRQIRANANNYSIMQSFEDTLGLNSQQETAAYNYRQLLLSGSNSSLNYENRDKGEDETIVSLNSAGVALSSAMIALLVKRYYDNSKNYRYNMFSDNTLLSISSIGEQQGFAQAGISEAINLDRLYKEWNTAADEKVRDSHRALDGVQVKFLDVFNTSLGPLRHPRDYYGAASNVISCRCWLEYFYK